MLVALSGDCADRAKTLAEVGAYQMLGGWR